MNKTNFLFELTEELSWLPQSEVDSSVSYYGELIDDKIEDGMSEEEAVASLGTPKEVAAEIGMDQPMMTLIKSYARPKGGKTGLTVTLAALSSPIWVPVGLCLVAIAVSLYIAAWAVVISLFAAVAALLIGGLCFAGLGIYRAVSGDISQLLVLGAGLVAIGAGIALLLLVKDIPKWLVRGTAAAIKKIKAIFVKKEIRE
ncbi:MAG: DUF1700 domain-containing protein [Clostridia bacterium]|nr:DUF1700 domain-containing protein [Clostridia bacterium]